jgi:putative two-component system response regulator
MIGSLASSAESVLDEIRSTIASIESLRGSVRRPPDRPQPDPAQSASPGAEQSQQTTAQCLVESDTQEIPLASVPSNTVPDKVPAASIPRDLSDTARLPRTAEKRQNPGKANSSSAHRAGFDDESDDVREATVVMSSRNESYLSLRGVDKSARIMIVDDEPLNVMTFRQHLKQEGYEHFFTTSDPREALPMMRRETPDVVLLDIRMPEISGMDILRVIGLDPVLQHIPVLVLTAASDPATRRQALDLGANDFLHKPIDPNELLPRVRNAIMIKKHFDMASGEATRLEQQVERRTRQLEATRQQLILCLARAAEHRDNDTGNHVIRVGRYTSIIARQMGYPANRLEMLEQAAQLHDVGKIGIPDAVLFKPGRLDVDEYELIKKHCALGRQIIEPITEKEWNILKTHTRIGESMLHVRSSSLLMLAARIAQTHHERWDGKGYPLGLQGEDIPLEGRIVAVADVFDALSSKRPYKEPFPRQKCFEILREGRGTQFDPAIVDAFFDCSEEITKIQLLLMDEEDRIPKGAWESVAQAALQD